MDKVFRDPVHNLIRFDRDRDQLVLQLIETREFQRLRNIRQMGVNLLVYPGATHTRFSHALGVAYLMKRVIEHFGNLTVSRTLARKLEEHRELLLATALLHDVGHFPFSHLIEDVANAKHEDWTARIIQDRESEIGRVLTRAKPKYATEITRILNHTFRPAFAVKLISSQLDVDRMEYLLRDSFQTGVRYGYFDAEWLIHSLRLVESDGDWELAIEQRKGTHAAEAYVLARYYMYQQVYHHKTSRAADAHVRKILKRATDLLNKGAEIPVTGSLRKLLVDYEKFSREDHYQLDDTTLLFAFKSWETTKDPILSDLCQRLNRRRLFKTIDLPGPLNRKQKRQIEQIARSAGFDPDYYLFVDRVTDDPYSDRYLVAGQPTTEGILLVEDEGELVELSQSSDIIRSIREKTIVQERLCLPGELRAEVLKILA
jgi:HD superfamily phosphohydrolase